VKLQKADDSALNMTPMIDIVFQLILFFLFNLRFKSQDWRIETMLPKHLGPSPTWVLDEAKRLRATLVRLDAEHPEKARTVVKVGGHEWTLPAVDAPEAVRDASLREIQAALGSLRLAHDTAGQIDVPPPKGFAVPHGDVVLVLDAFLLADFKEVDFQGTPAPRRLQ
jgi:biopolymer transport protein ExbD